MYLKMNRISGGTCLEAITLATPHIAGYSLDGKANGTTMSVRAISRFFGLGLDLWFPANIPAPELPEILCDASENTLRELFWEIYSQTYDMSSDDQRFRSAPDHLRGYGAIIPFEGSLPLIR